MNAPAGIGRSGMGPTQENERIEALDVLRGFALFGILLVNIGMFAYPLSEPFYLPAPVSRLDQSLHWLVTLLAQGKFYPLFSLLFGMGFALQLKRVYARGHRAAPHYLRRLAVLLIIGVAHGVFIWAGDILTAYALLGTILLPFATLSARGLLIAAVTALALQLLLIAAFMPTLSSAYVDVNGMKEVTVLRADAWSAYSSGSFMEVTRIRVREFAMTLQNLVFFGLQLFAMFLLGAWLGRQRVLAHPLRYRRLLKSMLVIAVVAGLPLSACYTHVIASIDYHGKPSPGTAAAFLLNIIAGVLMALGYLAAVTLAMQTSAARLLRYLAPVGRIALSNYLAQSVICTLIFYSYGLGLFGQLTMAQLLLIAIVVYFTQIVFSNWWISRFRFGPVEWLWRSATYLEWQPMRRDVMHASMSRLMRDCEKPD